VSSDSAIAASGLFFDLGLLDENAASHVALGCGLPETFADAEEMTPSQRDKLGCNQSLVHTDVMFGSSEVTVRATRSREGEVLLLDRGRWPKEFP
jgi:aminopeptidase